MNQDDEDDFLGESRVARTNHIDTSDEYYNFPPKLTVKSSPIRVKNIGQNDCPHLLKEIDFKTTSNNYIPSVPTSTNNVCHGNKVFSPKPPVETVSWISFLTVFPKQLSPKIPFRYHLMRSNNGLKSDCPIRTAQVLNTRP
jgi:hypothetical protein